MLPDWKCADIPCDVPCHTFNDLVGDVVTLAYRALCEDMTTEGCAEFTGYITVGEPSNPLGEYIGGWLQQVTPYNPANSRAGALQMVPRSLAAVGIKLMETGWPMIGDPEPNSVPSLRAVHAMALHSNSHAERITRALYNAVATRTVTESGCTFQGMGGMSPVPPTGGLVGWTWAVQLEVPW